MNILNVEDIERELVKISARAKYPQVRQWTKSVARNHILGRLPEKEIMVNFVVYTPKRQTNPLMPKVDDLPEWAKKALQRDEKLHWFEPAGLHRRSLWEAMQAVILWFNTWQPDDPRLGRIDKINFDTAVSAASMWFKDVNANVWEYVKDKSPVVKQYDNGFTWVKLTTSLQFEREGRLMSHCVYSHNYFERWQKGQDIFYSLRDSNNKPHITIQVNNDQQKSKLVQCKGNANSRPGDRYQPYLTRFIKDMGLVIAGDHAHIDCSNKKGGS